MDKKGRRYEVVFSGSGGQGIILGAVVLAEACGIHDGKCVCQTQSYGPESRGGFSRADVVISDRPIDYPMATEPDLLLAMNQTSCDRYHPELKADGLLVVDASLVSQIPAGRTVAIPFTEIAREQFGTEMVANMVSLGAVVQLTRLVSPSKLRAALTARAPQHTADLNRAALNAGIRAAKKIDVACLENLGAPEEEDV